MVLKKNESKEENIMLGSMGSWSHLYIIENLWWAHWAHWLMRAMTKMLCWAQWAPGHICAS